VSRLWYNPELRQTFGPNDEGPNEAQIAALDPSLRTSTETAKITLALHLPPLYYLLGVPFYWLVRESDLLARVWMVRQLSVLLGVGAVALAYGIARQVFPRRRAMWLTVPVLVSFQPMFTFTTSVVNTDALLILVFCALIYLSILALKTRLSLGLALGIGAGFAAGLLTKPFILAMVAPLGVVLVWEGIRVFRRRGAATAALSGTAGKTRDLGPTPGRHAAAARSPGVGRFLFALGAMAVVVLALWGPWVAHSARLGNSPFYANPIRTGQLVVKHPFYDYRLGRYVVDYGVSLLGGTWASLWGYFGWIDTPLDAPAYAVLYLACAMAALGLALYLARKVRRRAWDHEAGLLGFLALCLASVVGTLGAINYYSWRARGVGGGIQGRYYLGAIVPMVVLLAAGLLSLLPRRLRPAGHWLLCWAMILLHAVALFQVLLPRYYL
jgi:hypothetical protein